MSSTLKVTRLAICALLVGGAFYMCGPSASAETSPTPPSAQCMVQPSGVITPQMAEGFRAYWPLYVQIAAAESVDAILIAPLHYREHFGRDNPSNGQGIFQLYSLVKYEGQSFPGTGGQPVSDEEFIRQGKLAIDLLKGKVDVPLGQTPEGGYVKAAYYGYNGRNRLYASQARPGQGPWDGSPYVMNIPGQRELVMMTQDGGGGPRRLDPRPGAWPIYEELRRQCVTGPPPQDVPVPPASQAAPQTEGMNFNFFQLIQEPFSGGTPMQEFTVDWQPIHMDGEFILLVAAGLCAIAAAWFIHDGRWKRLIGMLVIGTLASLALMFALLADHIGTQWSYNLFWQNIEAIISAIVSWLTYPARVTAIKTALFGASILALIIFAVRFKTGGRSAFGDIGRAIKPIFAGLHKATRKVMSWHLAWTFVAAIFTLLVAASRLQGAAWLYGSSVTSFAGIAVIVLLMKKSQVTIEES